MVGGRGDGRPQVNSGRGPPERDLNYWTLVRCRASGELKRLGSELSGDRVSVCSEPFFIDLDAKFHRGLIRAGWG